MRGGEERRRRRKRRRKRRGRGRNGWSMSREEEAAEVPSMGGGIVARPGKFEDGEEVKSRTHLPLHPTPVNHMACYSKQIIQTF